MITDEDVKNEYKNHKSRFSLSSGGKFIPPMMAQIVYGITAKKWKNQKYSVGCRRHKLVFKTHNIIPEYCFDCYKIEIQPRNVAELFKLSFLFDNIELEDNNTRKCFLRPAKIVPSHYSGLIYFQGLSDAKKMLEEIKPVIDSEIGSGIPLFIKRGCTDFAKAHPEYAKLDENNEPFLLENKEWNSIDKRFDQENLASHLKPIPIDFHPKGATERKFLVMQTWLSYAKTIGDNSYMNITDSPIKVISGIQFAPFNAN